MEQRSSIKTSALCAQQPRKKKKKHFGMLEHRLWLVYSSYVSTCASNAISFMDWRHKNNNTQRHVKLSWTHACEGDWKGWICLNHGRNRITKTANGT